MIEKQKNAKLALEMIVLKIWLISMYLEQKEKRKEN